MDLIVKNSVQSKPEEMSLEPKAPLPVKKIRLPKVELSEGIKNYDKKVQENKLKVYTQNPYDYNSVSLKEKPDETPNQSAEQMISNQTYNTVAKFLGVDTIHDWNRYYDKVYAIVEWAKQESNISQPEEIMKWVADKVRETPNVGNKNIDNLYIFAKLFLQRSK